MNIKNGFLGFVTALVLAAFALPGIAAPAKIYSLNITPTSVASGAATAMTVVLKNETPTGNSSINSYVLSVTSGLTIASASTANGTVAVAPGGGSVAVTNMSPVKNGQSTTLTVNVTSPASCSASQATWSAVTWTGSSLGGDNFALVPNRSSGLTTTITSAGCSLQFSVPPQSSVAGTLPAVTVQEIGGLGNVPVTISVNTGPGALTGTLTQPASGGLATFSDLGLTTLGTYTLTAQAPGYGSVTSVSFTIFAGTLGCNTSNNYDSSTGSVDHTLDPDNDNSYVGTPGWALRRGANTDGSGCVLVDYTFTQDTTNNVASLTYDKSSGQNAAFEYTVLWAPVSVDAGGGVDIWTAKRPNVSWGVANPAVGSNDYVPALDCVLDPGVDLSTLTAAQLAALLPKIPNVAPFNTYTAADHPQYRPGMTALMCVAQQGKTSVGPDPLDSTRILVQYWDKIIDEVDGQVVLP